MEKAHGKTVKIHKARLIEGVLAALIIISLLNLFIIYTLTNSIASGAKPAEAPKPAELKITKISASCTDCFDIELVVSAIKQAGVSVQSERTLNYSSPEAKQLVSKYNISKLPALVITGDTSKADLSQFGEKVGDAYVFREAPVPYVDAPTGDVVGRVSIILLKDASCADCFDMSTLPAQLEQAGVKVSESKTVDSASSDGINLISKYNIKKVPAAIISKGLSEYPDIAEGWSRLGTQESDGSFILREVAPPYVSVDTGEVVGRVSLTVLNDPSCKECFDPSVLPVDVFEQTGVKIFENKTINYNSSAGRALASKYNITTVPALVLSKDLSAYPALVRSWSAFGSIESDGSYVWRKAAPYVSIGAGEVGGKVRLFSLTDSTCASCYDVSIQMPILVRMGLVFSGNSTVDVNSTEGKLLVSKYNITAVPTVVFSQEASFYPLLVQVWPQVGTAESDGWFVFRNMAAIRGATYRDLLTGGIKTAAAPQQ